MNLPDLAACDGASSTWFSEAPELAELLISQRGLTAVKARRPEHRRRLTLARQRFRPTRQRLTRDRDGGPHHTPTFGADAQGSAGAFDSPFWMSSIEIKSGVRMKAIWPSRGGRLIVTPAAFSLAQVA